MSINANWEKWCVASIGQTFEDGCGSTIPLFIEGQVRATKDEAEFVELRVDGPWTTEINKNYFRLFFEVSILVQATIDPTDQYNIRKLTGQISSMFNDINVYKYGDGGAYLGCLKLIQDSRKKERVQTNHFGQINPSVPLQQATVEGHYEIHLSN